jgi:Major capsid protein Gp23
MDKSFDQLIEKWAPVLDASSAPKITDHHRRAVTAALLENQELAFASEAQQNAGFITEVAANATGDNSVANWNPVLISLVRRAMPNLMAYDVCGVQPMTGPTGLIFAMKSRYGKSPTDARDRPEALFKEAVTGFSGDSSTDSTDPSGFWNAAGTSGLGLGGADSNIDSERNNRPDFGKGKTTAQAEALGNTGSQFAEMGFSIEKATVTAVSRALKAEYTLELAQDLKAIHGLDAETELSNILSTEILAEINREVIRTINSQAKTGMQTSNAANKGIFDLSLDADGRWSAEKFKGLGVQLDRECNQIAKDTRRGKGNIAIVSSDVATALAASGMLDYTPAINSALQIDDTGNTFAGIFNGKIKVYIDPYSVGDYCTVGYKGSNPYDAGVFYCPYVPLQMMRAVGENDFQPRIGFKTRYGMVSNPFVGNRPADGLAAPRSNMYYRIFRVDNILA